MIPVLFVLLGTLSLGMNAAADFSIPGPSARAPVVHLGRYHILTNGRTAVVLDGARGLSIALVGERPVVERSRGSLSPRLGAGSVQVELADGDKRVLLDQANDPAPRLQIISQGPNHAAARIFFSLCAVDGKVYGTGTLDITVYEGRVHLAPSLFVDYLTPTARVVRAGLEFGAADGSGTPLVRGRKLAVKGDKVFESFGGEAGGFDLTLERQDGGTLKLGWLRNRYPQWIYLREVDRNPETDDLYERWPLWLSQRGSPLGWWYDESSGLEVEQSKGRTSKISFLWVRGGSVPVPAGGYLTFNAPLTLVLGRSRADADALWQAYAHPLAPVVASGDFRHYNEIEGLYELDSRGQPIDLTFDAAKETIDRQVLVRVWNLGGKGAQVFMTDGAPTPTSLLNDGDLVEDPLVFIVKTSTGPARSAIVSVAVPAGKKVRLTGSSKPGLQLAYQMYSDLETYEAWSERCDIWPLFRLHLKELAIYQATFPGAKDYAFFKLPLYYGTGLLKDWANPTTYASQLRDFEVVENGPEEILFTLRSVTSEATGLSTYTCRVPNAPEALSFEVSTEFVPLDDGLRWATLQYCDIYPFEDIYRRNFHYRDVTYLTQSGVFERVGSGAWNLKLRTFEEPGGMGCYGEVGERQGPGAKVPGTEDGSVWLLGNNPERGNILFRRGRWEASAGAQPLFSLCNAWMDIHNSIGGRRDPTAVEKLSYALDIFPGAVPDLDVLNRWYRRDAGQAKSPGIKAVRYSPQGEILGFIPE